MRCYTPWSRSPAVNAKLFLRVCLFKHAKSYHLSNCPYDFSRMASVTQNHIFSSRIQTSSNKSLNAMLSNFPFHIMSWRRFRSCHVIHILKRHALMILTRVLLIKTTCQTPQIINILLIFPVLHNNDAVISTNCH